MHPTALRTTVFALSWALTAACNNDVVPNFHLVDQNPASQTFAETVSPRDFVGQVSAWYFGNAG